MRQQAMGFMKGMGTGIVASVAFMAIGNRMSKGNRNFRHRAGKTMRNIGELLDTMQEVFR